MADDKETYLAYKKTAYILAKMGLGRIKLIKRIHRVVDRSLYNNITKGEYVPVLGHKMFLDKQDTLGLRISQFYGPFETKTVMALLKPTDIVLDIGANIGYYTLIFAKHCSHVFAFEPEPTNFAILLKNIEINGYSNKVTLEQAAVSDIDGITILYLCDDNAGMHRIFESQYCRNDTGIKTKTIRLDNYLKTNNIGEIDFVKMDTEGAEIAALEGLGKYSYDFAKAMMIEFYPPSIIEFGREPKEIVELIKSYGFKIWIINSDKQIVEPLENIDYLISTLTVKATNLLCRKSQ